MAFLWLESFFFLLLLVLFFFFLHHLNKFSLTYFSCMSFIPLIIILIIIKFTGLCCFYFNIIHSFIILNFYVTFMIVTLSPHVSIYHESYWVRLFFLHSPLSRNDSRWWYLERVRHFHYHEITFKVNRDNLVCLDCFYLMNLSPS